MQKVSKIIILGAAGFAVAGLVGCSTVLRGTHEKVEIVSNPPGALCKIYRDGEGFLKSVRTPGEKYIPRSTKPIEVVCVKEGYEKAVVFVSPSTSGIILGNVSTVALGTVVDAVSSAHHELPDTISVDLKKI